MPPPCGGPLTLGEDGNLRCDHDQGVQAMLEFIDSLDSSAVRGAELSHDARIHVEWDGNLMEKMDAFMKLAGGNLLLATDLLRDAIAKGEHAFTPEARVPGTTQHPTEFLRDIGLRIHVTPDTTGVASRLQAVLTEQSDDPVRKARIAKFRGDFGAMSLLSLATNKDFKKELLYGLAASLAGTGAIGAAFDYGIWNSVKNAMGPDNAAKYGPYIDSVTPLFAETFDSAVIARLLVAMKGGEFMPKNFNELLDNLKDAGYSGSVAAIGSIPNNVVRDMAKAARDSGWHGLAVSLLVVKQLTNLLATWTSGAMVPLDAMKDHAKLVDAKIGLMRDGTIPQPTAGDVSKHVRDEAFNTLRAARGTGSSIRSMAIGGEIAATLGLTLSVLEHYGVIPSSVEQLITLIYSTPTEVISMLSTMAIEKWVGAEADQTAARITTDSAKQSGMLGQIARSDSTSLADLDRIARPDGERNAQLGYVVTLGLGGVMGLVEKGAGVGGQYMRMLASGMQALSGAAHEGARRPIERGAAWTAEMIAGTFAPVLTPLGEAMRAGTVAAGTYALRPAANGVAMAFDGLARGPEAVANLTRLRNRHPDARPGDDMV
ncbi:hypothetical protein DIE21_19645 [Burkholderia sp. Bp9140]|nr:hypothetical protein DIE21_19645 [Burkholderia sp. Bp9140]